MRSISFWLLSLLVFWPLPGPAQELRPPAVPLVTIDPYTSVWSFADKANADPTRHWTGRPHQLTGLLRVDGKTYQFLGKTPPPVNVLLPTAEKTAYAAHYTTQAPVPNWMQPAFADASWQTGAGDYGSQPDNKTRWETPEIWVRREFDLQETAFNNLLLQVRHDDDVDVYLNGVPVYSCAPCVSSGYKPVSVPAAARQTLKKGKNVLALHCKNTGGPGFLDAGLIDELKENPVPGATQESLQVTATRSAYTFAAGGVRLTATFTSPLLMEDLETLSRPVSYLTLDTQSGDGKPHDVQVYFGATPEWAVHSPFQPVTWSRGEAGEVQWLRTGTESQQVLVRRGDDVRIDWGYFYLGAPRSGGGQMAVAEATAARRQFSQTGKLTLQDDRRMPRPANEQMVELATVLTPGRVGPSVVSQHLLIGYDDLSSVQYFGQNLPAWWRKDGKATMNDALQAAEKEYAALGQTCRQFDEALYAEAEQAGGPEYAHLCALVYGQAIAAHMLVAGPGGVPLFFSKENFSNGSIGTVDITYPSAPLFLHYNPVLLRGMLEPIFYYSESGKWTKPFAAHDVGTYPQANGQTYPEDMPVEECGNMLILAAAVVQAEGKPDYARGHWPTLTTWAGYLEKEGFDPANQLSTDDFAGHLARNANLSVKAILGLACYGKLAGQLGEAQTAAKYQTLARDLARRWMLLADDGDHYSLTFGGKGTWSQKYNLVWDKLLKLDIFPPEVARREIAYYLTRQQPYGLPLDSRRTYTKSDWIIWTATIADRPEDFRKLVLPVYRFVHETPTRVPVSDWHETTDGKAVGFRARSVVGGYFIKMLEKRWQKGN
ncbi:MAG: DUF4965 domain-containing protein [Cytophagales bacterium]|nr:DUF4965 domain-containing protein [Cytophagales bacterium]